MIPGFFAAAARSGPRLWTPADLPAPPSFWVDGLSDVTLESGHVSQWADRSGNGWDAAQSTPANAPGIEQNPRHLVFDNNNWMTLDSGAVGLYQNVETAWLLAVFKRDAADMGATNRPIISFGNNTGAVRVSLYAGSTNGSNRVQMGGRRLDGEAFDSLRSPDQHFGEWVISLGVHDYAARQISLTVNGSPWAVKAGAWTGSGATSNTPSANARLGRNNAPTADTFLDGRIAVALAGVAPPSPEDAQRLVGWAAWQCGLQDDLPIGNPYREAPPTVAASPFTLSNGATEHVLSVPFVQGVEVSGDFAWVTSSGETTVLRKFQISDWTVVESATLDDLTPGFNPTSLGDPALFDGVLYIPCGVYSDGGAAYVIEVDPDTLDYIDHHDLSADCDMGVNTIVRYDGKWYVGETAALVSGLDPALRVFDDAFNYEVVAWKSQNGFRIDFNGATMIESGPIMVVGAHRPGVYAFKLGAAAELVDVTDLGLVDIQGVSYSGGYLYVSYRAGGQRVERYDLALKG